MKKIYTFLVIAFIGFVGNAQIVNISDANFKAKLLAASPSNTFARNFSGSYVKIDTNSNNEIEVAEALLIDQLNVSNSGSITSVKISNLIGLTSFSNLTQFYCFDNLIGTLDLSALTNLTVIGCDQNRLTMLNISGLTNLINLSCEQNLITSLDLTNKPNLTTLNCPENNLSNLNLSGLTNLSDLRASNNPYSTLDFTGLSRINSLQCMNTNISTLDVSNLHTLNLIMCGNNPNLATIFMKNGALESGLNLNNVPSLDYICVDEDQLNTVQSHVNAFSNAPNCIINTYCSFVPGGNYYTIQINTQYDNDNNGCDTMDVPIPFIKFSITNGASSGLLISNPSGGFLIPVQAGTHTITPAIETPSYFTVSPSNASITFPTSTSPYAQNFCITPNGIYNDLEIAIIPVNVARPGEFAGYNIIYKNKGTSSQSGIISLNFDDSVMDLFMAGPLTNSQTINTLSWNFSNLLPFETRTISIIFTLNTPTATPPLDAEHVLVYTATVSSGVDETPNDNTAILNQTVLNSLDPNDKTCGEGGNLHVSEVGKYLHYIIRFENTGTANAQNIVVKDIIDTTKLDVSTLIPLSGSHPFETKISSTNQVEFIFQNINLSFDDANNDGYVAFKIKSLPTLVPGNVINNTANIYFDYNAPITTNTNAVTVFNPLATPDFDFGSIFILSPIPARNVLKITTKQSVVISSVSIYNTLGQLIQTITNPNETIDVSGLKIGSYFIKIISDKGTASSKFLKQ